MKKISIFIVLLFLFTMMAGCAASRLEMDYGTSYNLAKYNQTLNPDAEKNLDPVYGLDGWAAAAAMEKYRKSCEKPADAQATSYTLNIGATGK